MANTPPFNLPHSLQQAFQAFGSGRIDVAANIAELIIKRFPREPNAHYLMGNINHHKREFDQAAKFYKKAYKFDRNNVGALSGLGTVALDTFHFSDAIQHFQKAIKLAKKPDSALLNNLGLAYKGKNEVKKAQETFEKAIKTDDKSAVAHLNLGQLASVLGLTEKARQHYLVSLKYDPNNPEALTNLGSIERIEGNLSKAIKLFQKVLKVDPSYLLARNHLAHAYIDIGNFEEAEELYRESYKQDKNQPKVLIELGELLYERGRKDEACDLYNEATKSVEIASDLSNLETYTIHRLAIAYERLKDFKNAFRFYKEAHAQWNEALIASGNNYDPKKSEKSLEHTIDVFSAIPAHKKNRGHPSKRPIFITGMPRSGTSLLEQILASHPDIYGAGELDLIPKFKEEITVNHKNWISAISDVSDNQLKEFGLRYLEDLETKANGEAYFIDKLPHNFQNIGLIRLIFPNALIIHNKRNPIDTCLSVFKQKFGTEMQFDHTLEDIAHYYRYYDKLTEFWHVWDNSITTVIYESIISNQEAETKRLLDLLDLPWNDNCLQFYKTDRDVKTASRLQVRQPLYKSSVEKWRVYENELQPLIKGLGDLVSDN